jgi:hypothetical protein
MLSLIGFVIVWPVSCLFLGMIINTLRVRNGHNIVDYFSFFMQGFALGPIGVLYSFAPQAQQKGTAIPVCWGGICGTFASGVTYVYLNP